jgi:hypothetical protein
VRKFDSLLWWLNLLKKASMTFIIFANPRTNLVPTKDQSREAERCQVEQPKQNKHSVKINNWEETHWPPEAEAAGTMLSWVIAHAVIKLQKVILTPQQSKASCRLHQ